MDDDSKLNPGQADIDRKTDFLKRAEENQAKGNESANTNSLKSAEEGVSGGSGGWANNVNGLNLVAKSKIPKKLFKRKGPLTFVFTLVIGGSLFMSVLFSPSILIVQMKEILTSKFNNQLASMDVRSTKLLVQKSNLLGGVCTSVVNIRCKYSTMSQKQIDNFKTAGIDIAYDPGVKTLTGRYQVKGLTYDNKTVLPTGIMSEIKTNPKFRSMLKVAYNPKYAGFTDSPWKKVTSLFGISKRPKTVEGDNFDDKFKNLDEDLTDETKLTKQALANSVDEINPNTGEKFSNQAELDEYNKKVGIINQLVDDFGTDKNVTSKLLSGVGTAVEALKVTSVVDDLCNIHQTARAVGMAAKMVRVVQLAKYAMLFLVIADQIKAGDAQPDQVSFYGDILTKQSEDDEGNMRSATDSFGYKYAMYGEIGEKSTSVMRYVAAAGATGIIAKLLYASPKINSTCKFLGNPLVGVVSFLVGAVAALFSMGTLTAANLNVKLVFAATKTATKEMLSSFKFWKELAGNIGINFASFYLPGLLGDIIAGNIVDETTVGANSGDAITSGASGIMGSTAKFGGNAPLTPEQAVKYSELAQNINNQYAEEDVIALSPFDVNNSNTFMGKIVSSLIPYTSKMSSFSGVISSIASISTKSFSFLSPTTKAATIEDYKSCTDYEYSEIKLATDPFCNVYYGIGTKELNNDDPLEVVDDLLTVDDPQYDGDAKLPQIDEITGEPIDAYTKFVEMCINNTTPLGTERDLSSNEMTLENHYKINGSDCIFGQKVPLKVWMEPVLQADGTYKDVLRVAWINNKNYYLHYIDQRVNTGMEGA